MKPGETIKVLEAEYKIDAKDGVAKLYYYCEVDNSSTVSGGSRGKDKGWIYAGYVQMDMPAPYLVHQVIKVKYLVGYAAY